ncbi:MAG TPA: hypothetical protein VIP77_20085 [Jiangellaceae bacterium]
MKKARGKTAARRGRASSSRGRDAASRGAARRGSSLTRKVRDRDRNNVVMLPAHRYQSTAGQQMAPVVPLPVLRPGADAVLTGPQGQERAAAAGQAVTGLSRWLWKHRWPLAPFAAAAGVAAGAAGDPAMSTAVLAAVAAAGHAAAKKLPELLGERVWLSLRERVLVGNWAMGAAAWSTGVGFGWFDVDLGGLALLGAATGVQAKDWINSRRIRRENRGTDLLGPIATALIAAWPDNIGVRGPDALRGSRIVAETMTEPTQGVYAFSVELREGVHNESAVSDDTRRYVERELRMPVGTVELTVDRDDSALVRVSLSPARQLETTSAVWEGPALTPAGLIPIAVTRDGRVIYIALYNEGGAEHAIIGGGTNTGKSYTLGVVIAAGVAAGLEVVWYLDGGDGASAPHLAHAVDWWTGRNTDEWSKMIRAAHAVMESRAATREMTGDGPWCPEESDDPVLSVVIDEAAKAKRKMSAEDERLLDEIASNGRKHGVRLIQVTQDLGIDSIIGGRVTGDNLMAGGSTIGHRVGSTTASTIAGKGTTVPLQLNGLPEEPGWVGIYRRGNVLAEQARVYDTGKGGARFVEHMRDVTLRTITDEDAAAAGEAYRNRETGKAAVARMAANKRARNEARQRPTDATDASRDGADSHDPISPAATTEDATMRTDQANQTTGNVVELGAARDKALTGSQLAAAKAAESRQQAILLTLQTFPIGCTRAQLIELTEMPEATLDRHIRVLKANGRVVQVDAGGRKILRLAGDIEQAG